MARDGVLLDAADAVASRQQVDWDRTHRSARLDQRRSLDNLRDLSRMFAPAGDRRPPGGSGTAVSKDPPGTTFGRFALGTVVVLAAVQVATTLATLPWWWALRMARPFGPFQTLMLVSLSACALLLFFGGRRDYRARLLGAFFFAAAAAFSRPLVGGYPILPEVFMPALLWAFAREFPRVRRRSWIDGLARRMVPGSAAIGCALWIANLPWVLGWLPFLKRQADDSVYWMAPLILTLSAIAAIAWRARDAVGEESRRVMLLIGGVVIGIAPIFLDSAVEMLWPAARRFGDDHRGVIAAVVFTCLLSFPCSMTYAVLAERALDVRTAVRASYRRLLTRRLLTATIVAPLVGMGWLFASQTDRTVTDIMASSPARLLVAAVGVAALAAGWRRRLLVRLDAWVYPEAEAHRHLLVVAGSELTQASSASQVDEAVSRAVRRGCGAPATLVISAPAGEVPSHHLNVRTADLASLDRASAIAHVLEATREPIRVDPDDGTSLFALLPDGDAAWVVSMSVVAVVPILGSGAQVIGVIAVGRPFDDRRLSAFDLDFLQALAAGAGLAIGRVRLEETPTGRAAEAPPARECATCGIVASAHSGRLCRCGADYSVAPVPAMLAGKFSVERRVGSGGMGAVYVAQDVVLQRQVAVKTLPSATVRGPLLLTEEARAMAAVAHPAIAQIHGLETWRGRPLLVVEFLPGGTLTARLERGPLPGAEAVGVAVTLSEALAALHAAGYVHGDVKPSNIGFASDGTAKLLDFGLARLTSTDDRPAGGTLSYMSPEVLLGGPVGEADDVWSLCVVLYEMVAGRRPFVGNGADEVATRVRRQRIHPAAVEGGQGEQAGSRSSRKLIAFVVSILTAARSVRPQTARAFADALRGF